MAAEMKTCESCEGTGRHATGFYDHDGGAETFECPECGGIGRVKVCTRGKECLPEDCTCGVKGQSNG